MPLMNETLTTTIEVVTKPPSPPINQGPINQVIEFIFTPQGIFLVVILGILFYFLFIRKKKKDDAFNSLTLPVILRDRIGDGILKIIQEKDKQFGTLRRGDITIGRIKRYGSLICDLKKPPNPWEQKPRHKTTKKETGDIKDKRKPGDRIVRLNIFEVSTHRGLFGLVKEFLGIGFILIIIPDPIVKRISFEQNHKIIDYFNVTQDLDITSFGNVYFYGSDSFDYLKGQAWLKGREDELEELVNYSKRVVFLETHHARHVEEMDELYAMDEKKRKGWLSSMLPGGK